MFHSNKAHWVERKVWLDKRSCSEAKEFPFMVKKPCDLFLLKKTQFRLRNSLMCHFSTSSFFLAWCEWALMAWSANVIFSVEVNSHLVKLINNKEKEQTSGHFLQHQREVWLVFVGVNGLLLVFYENTMFMRKARNTLYIGFTQKTFSFWSNLWTLFQGNLTFVWR